MKQNTAKLTWEELKAVLAMRQAQLTSQPDPSVQPHIQAHREPWEHSLVTLHGRSTWPPALPKRALNEPTVCQVYLMLHGVLQTSVQDQHFVKTKLNKQLKKGSTARGTFRKSSCTTLLSPVSTYAEDSNSLKCSFLFNLCWWNEIQFPFPSFLCAKLLQAQHRVLRYRNPRTPFLHSPATICWAQTEHLLQCLQPFLTSIRGKEASDR